MKEIERKYFLKGFLTQDEVNDLGGSDYSINQGYLSVSENHSIRIRISEESCLVTEKIGKGFVREEKEFEISHGAADILFKLTEGKRIKKTRTVFPKYNSQQWFIDIFEGGLEGLILAEVELDSEDVEVSVLDYIKPLIIRDVTEESEYYNSNLAR